jgi:hypothetical protein
MLSRRMDLASRGLGSSPRRGSCVVLAEETNSPARAPELALLRQIGELRTLLEGVMDHQNIRD